MEKTFRIIISEGLHARPATLLVSAVVAFAADVQLIYKNKSVNLKSIMGLMAQAIPSGAIVTISANGIDEDKAIRKVTDVMISEGLGEEC